MDHLAHQNAEYSWHLHQTRPARKEMNVPTVLVYIMLEGSISDDNQLLAHFYNFWNTCTDLAEERSRWKVCEEKNKQIGSLKL